jgi:hypothetical protein
VEDAPAEAEEEAVEVGEEEEDVVAAEVVVEEDAVVSSLPHLLRHWY